MHRPDSKPTTVQFFRKLIRKSFLDIAGKFAVPSAGIHILNGHYLSRDTGDPQRFHDLLRQLQKQCRLIRIEEAVEMIAGHESPTEPCVAFTFDDGLDEHASAIAPVLEQFNINAAFFINPGFMDGDLSYRANFQDKVILTPGKVPMTWDQVMELQQRGHIIGSHGQNHLRLNTDDMDMINRELLVSKQTIEQHTGVPCIYFAYPYGGMADLSATALGMAQQHYHYIFSQSDHWRYHSFHGAVINRRHFEPFWPEEHIRYFLSVKKT